MSVVGTSRSSAAATKRASDSATVEPPSRRYMAALSAG